MTTQFNQGAPTVPTLINSSSVLVTGNAASANALTVRQFGGGNVFSAQTTTGSTALFVGDGGLVGIGTADPKGPIHSYTGRLGYPDSSGSGTSNVVARIQSGSICLDFGSIGGTNPFWIQNHLNTAWNTTYPILLNPNGGSVGIGTTSPASVLSVQGGAASGRTDFYGDAIEIGAGRTADGATLIDFHTAEATYGDYSARILRNSAANGSLTFYNRGTGEMQFVNQEAGGMVWYTSGAERMRIAQGGAISYGTTYKYNTFYASPNWSYSTSTLSTWVSLWSFSFSLSVASYVDIGATGHWLNTAAGNAAYIGIGVDGNAPAATSSYFDNYTLGSASVYGPGLGSTFYDTCANSAWWQGYTHTTRVKLAAGSHTASLWCWGYGGTYYFNGGGMSLQVTPVSYL